MFRNIKAGVGLAFGLSLGFAAVELIKDEIKRRNLQGNIPEPQEFKNNSEQRNEYKNNW